MLLGLISWSLGRYVSSPLKDSFLLTFEGLPFLETWPPSSTTVVQILMYSQAHESIVV